ncbi:MAG: hypothetical protein ACYC6C_12285 [Coriobacteriia bacterium]
MKLLYLSITFSLSLLFISCSSTYKISDFSSKDKFYEDFNNFAKGKTLNIFLENNISFISEISPQISNDSLIYLDKIQKEQAIFKKRDIKNVTFYYNRDKACYSANISLKNGEELNEDNIELLPDSSIKFIVYKNITKQIPLSNIKEVSYKNHWLGVPFGFLPGTIVGFIIGYWIDYNNPGTNSTVGDQIAIPIGTVLGLMVGSIWGWLNGWDYTYQFNR